VDSDTITIFNVLHHLFNFVYSNCDFLFVPDHVMYDKDFQEVWKIHRCYSEEDKWLIPQACFMGFRSSVIKDFFATWKNIWKEWIEPSAFHNFKNPQPEFIGSTFCIEQYALGMALFAYLGSDLKKVCFFNRDLLELYPSYFSAPTNEIRCKQKNVATNVIEDRRTEERPRGIPCWSNRQTSIYRFSQNFPHSNYVYFSNKFMYKAIPISPMEMRTAQYNPQTSKAISVYRTADDILDPNSIIVDLFFQSIIHTYNEQWEVAYNYFKDVYNDV